MSELRIRLAADGTVLAVPNSLDAITTYVLLEQEAWFEKEVAFVRRFINPGMTAIDIGANLGTYSIPMARLAGAAGAVIAYEPASSTRALLELSGKLNHCTNLTVVGAAISDRLGEAHLNFGGSSELNALGEGANGERVGLTTLDNEDAAGRWARSPDFIKIDAEGEEDRILSAAGGFFARHSPLVMFEIKSAAEINHGLWLAFQAMGYETYRLLGDASVLVPAKPGDPVDPFELNYFAAKPDRAARMATDGLLALDIPVWSPEAARQQDALTLFKQFPFGRMLTGAQANAPIDPSYRDGLLAYQFWRSTTAPLGERCGALNFALTQLQSAAAAKPSLPRLSTLARVAYEAGQRLQCVQALMLFGERISKGDLTINELLWPASSRFDAIDPGSKLGSWFLCAAFEHLELVATYSSVYGQAPINLSALTANTFSSTEMLRRLILQRARSGLRPKVPIRLCETASDHVNAELWRTGAVPGTVL